MNLGQSLFAIGALLLLSLNIMSVNTRILRTDEVALNSKIGVLATSIGTSIIEDASKLSFDEKTRDDAVFDSLSLTFPLGREKDGEINDFDDYNNYTKIDTVFTIPFKAVCKVDYINPSNPDNAITSKTWHKKLTVNITTPFSQDTIKLSTIYSYWFFR
jgi:MSHA pilin protein MshD